MHRGSMEPVLADSVSLLYFIQEHGVRGAVKIGTTFGRQGLSARAAVTPRLRGAQTGNPRLLRVVRVYVGAFWLERSVHDRFRRQGLWLRGEWFKPAALHSPLPRELRIVWCDERGPRRIKGLTE
jgi:hypothetical protein